MLVPVEEYQGVEATTTGWAAVAAQLRHRREDAGLSQRALATAAGVRHETISRIENGHHVAETATIQKIEQAIADAKRAK